MTFLSLDKYFCQSLKFDSKHSYQEIFKSLFLCGYNGFVVKLY